MSVSVTLRQETDFVDGVGYRVISEIISANPEGMGDLFILQPGIDPWGEVYLRVATLDDLNEYVGTALNFFYDSTPGKFASAVPGDVLVVDTAVPEWLSTYFTNQEFTVTYVDPSGNFIVTADKPFPLPKHGLAWTLKDSLGATKTTGSDGYTSFEDFGIITEPFRRNRLTSILDSVEKASSRAIAIKTGIESLVNAAKIHGPDFEGIETVTYE